MAEKNEPTKPDAKPAGSSKLLLIVLVLVLLDLGGTAFVGFRVTLGSEPAPSAVTNDAAVDASGPTFGPIHEVEKPFVVNLNEAQAGRYLKVRLSVEVADEQALADLQNAEQIVRDDLLRYLSGLTVDDVIGEEAKGRVHDAILARLADALGEGRVKRVLFSEFVIQ